MTAGHTGVLLIYSIFNYMILPHGNTQNKNDKFSFSLEINQNYTI